MARPRSETLRVRLTAQEHAAVRAVAQQLGITASDMARHALHDWVQGHAGVELLRRPPDAGDIT